MLKHPAEKRFASHVKTNQDQTYEKRKWVFLSLFVVLAAMTIFSAGVKAEVDFKREGLETFFLKNGMQVVVIPDRRAPVVTHMVWYKVGAADEDPGQSGNAHFLEHLMFKGTKNLKPGEFSKIVAQNGGQENAFTSQDYTGYYQRVASDRLPLMMQMEADRMRNLVLTEEIVRPELEVIKEERRSRTDNSPSGRLGEQLNAVFYLAHPYGTPVIGWPADIAALNRDTAIEFYKRHYAPNNAILIVAGDIDAKTLKPLAEKYYGVIPSAPEIGERRRMVEPEPQTARRATLKDPRVASPSSRGFYLAPSYSTAKPGEAEALDVLAQIMGGGATSRLHRSLVLDKKIAAGAGAWYDSSNLDNGKIAVYGSSLPGKKIEDIEAAIDEVINEVLANGVTTQEVERAKNSMISQAIYAQDSQTHLARIFGVALTTGQKVEDVIEWPQRIEKTTLEQVNQGARKYLKSDVATTGILLKAKIAENAS
jgi:zinc protease